MKYEDKIEKVLSVTTEGIIKSYPQKYIKTKKSRITNEKIDYISSQELLDRVSTNKLINGYNKRIKSMSYKIYFLSLKEFKYEFEKWLDKLFKLSNEEGNSLNTIAKRDNKLKLNIVNDTK